MNDISESFSDAFGDNYEDIQMWRDSPKTSEDGLELLDKQNKIKDNIKTEVNTLAFKSEIMSGNLGSSEAIMNTLQNRYDSKTKVNLDEELSNSIKFQKAYEAAAILVRTGDEMLKTLLEMKR